MAPRRLARRLAKVRPACLRRTLRPHLSPTRAPRLAALQIPLCPLDGRDLAPCDVATVSGGAGTTRTRHRLGPVSGAVSCAYEMFGIPDSLDIYGPTGLLLATTDGPVSGSGVLLFDWIPLGGIWPQWVETVVIGPTGTAWRYTLSCPTT